MKLNKLRSVVHNALRDSTWAQDYSGPEPFSVVRPRGTITIDLITGEMVPDMKGDDVWAFYQQIVRWFHEVLPKEGIPIEIIESARMTITPEGKTCTVVAQGRKFEDEVRY